MGVSFPIIWMTDALQGQWAPPPQDTPGALPGEQLAGVRQGAPATRQPDGVGDAGGLGGLAPTQDGSAGPVAHGLGHPDRARAPVAPGPRSAGGGNRKPAAIARPPARLGYWRSRPYGPLPGQPRPA